MGRAQIEQQFRDTNFLIREAGLTIAENLAVLAGSEDDAALIESTRALVESTKALVDELDAVKTLHQRLLCDVIPPAE